MTRYDFTQIELHNFISADIIIREGDIEKRRQSSEISLYNLRVLVQLDALYREA